MTFIDPHAYAHPAAAVFKEQAEVRGTDKDGRGGLPAHSLVALACQTWQTASAFPQERAVIGARVRGWTGRFDDRLLLAALSEYASQRRTARTPSAPYHAIGFTERVARERITAIREREHNARKQEERPEVLVDKGLRGIGAIIDDMRRTT